MRILKTISLRRRLTLWSTLILMLVISIFGMFAYFSVSSLTNVLYQPIDENLKRQAAANLIYISRLHQLGFSQVGGVDEFDSVFFSVIDSNGKPLVEKSQYVPISEKMLQQALDGDDVLGTLTLPDGRQRARVYLSPFVFDGHWFILQAATPLFFIDQLLNTFTLYLVVAALVLLVVSATGSYIVSGRALRAVDTVTQKAREIETSQDLSRRIPEPSTDDEIGNLARTFNQMLARLDSAFSAQRRFVADSSHELRTPLTVIRGNLHLLRRAANAEERNDLISITEAEISRLNRMVNDLLYMAQMQSGHDLKPIMRTVELDSLLLDVFALARSMVALKEQKILLIHEDIAATSGDRDQLQHLLLNLVDNAVKYTPEQGTITLGLWADGAWARIEVRDTGKGIAKADIPLLFERFFRSPDARQTERNGSGLGLAIVNSIVEAHNGRIEVFSREGEGSTFRVWLPMAGAQKENSVADDDAVLRFPPRRRRITMAAVGQDTDGQGG